MILIFVGTGIISSVLMVIGVKFFPSAIDINPALNLSTEITNVKAADQIIQAFTVSNFSDLLSKKNMLALILFSALTGLAASAAGEKGKIFSGFLRSANEVMMKLISYIMFYAPIGLCAYFAYLVG